MTDELGSTSMDFVLTIIHPRTGAEILTKHYGSLSEDKAIDLAVNHFGIYIMAEIGSGFHDINSDVLYSTQNNNLNFAIIFTDHNGEIYEIESYDQFDSKNYINGSYPKKLLAKIKNDQEPNLIFISADNGLESNQEISNHKNV